MLTGRKLVVYNITEDDFIEHERCTEQLRRIGMEPESIDSMALRCHRCPVSGRCGVRRENLFLGARTC